jgi:hypothetical protein
MRRFLLSLAAAGVASLWGSCAWAAEVPHAFSSTGPALASFESQLTVAWTADSRIEPRKVWYSTFDGAWTPQAEVPDALTSVAPALAVVGEQLYLATTGVDEQIHYYASQNGAFNEVGKPLCDAETCTRTLAAPALAGHGASLFAAWSTPQGSIRYADLENGAWNIAPLPIPNAVTKATAAPTLAVYLDRLFVAWVSPQEDAIWIASTALPLTSGSWSEPPKKIAVKTKVAPALGVLAAADSPPNSVAVSKDDVLYLSWTDAGSTVRFSRWESLFGQWVTTESPVPLPPGPLTQTTPALTSCVRAESAAAATDALPDAAAVGSRYNVVGVTTPGGSLDIFCGQRVTPPK